MSKVNHKRSETVDSERALLLRGNEVAHELGISRALAYRLMQDGTLPVVRIGRAVRVPSDGLRRWVSSRTAGGQDCEIEPPVPS